MHDKKVHFVFIEKKKRSKIKKEVESKLSLEWEKIEKSSRGSVCEIKSVDDDRVED